MQKPPAKKHSWAERFFLDAHLSERQRTLKKRLSKRLLLLPLPPIFLGSCLYYFSPLLAAICWFIASVGLLINAIYSIRDGAVLGPYNAFTERKREPIFFWLTIVSVHFLLVAVIFFVAIMVFLEYLQYRDLFS